MRLVRRARVVPLWQALGLGLLFLVAVWSLPLGARPADGVSSVLPSMRPVTAAVRAELDATASAAPVPDRPASPSRPTVLALALVLLVVAVAVVIGRVAATTTVLHGIVGPARRGRAPPRT